MRVSLSPLTFLPARATPVVWTYYVLAYHRIPSISDQSFHDVLYSKPTRLTSLQSFPTSNSFLVPQLSFSDVALKAHPSASPPLSVQGSSRKHVPCLFYRLTYVLSFVFDVPKNFTFLVLYKAKKKTFHLLWRNS